MRPPAATSHKKRQYHEGPDSHGGGQKGQRVDHQAAAEEHAIDAVNRHGDENDHVAPVQRETQQRRRRAASGDDSDAGRRDQDPAVWRRVGRSPNRTNAQIRMISGIADCSSST